MSRTWEGMCQPSMYMYWSVCLKHRVCKGRRKLKRLVPLFIQQIFIERCVLGIGQCTKKDKSLFFREWQVVLCAVVGRQEEGWQTLGRRELQSPREGWGKPAEPPSVGHRPQGREGSPGV